MRFARNLPDEVQALLRDNGIDPRQVRAVTVRCADSDAVVLEVEMFARDKESDQ